MTEEIKSTPAPAPATPTAPTGQSPAPEGRPPFHKRRPEVRRKVCRLCTEKIAKLDYKNAQFVKSFTMDSGKILSRRITGACARHQRQITIAVKRNRNLAVLPYTTR